MTARTTGAGQNPAAQIADGVAGSRTRGVRVESVDTLRGLTILLMLFVNDLGPAAPAWMHHIDPPRTDGMTVADVVFPSFLFIVGVSIPLALERAARAGVSRGTQVRHILGRTAALLLWGVIELNHDADIRMGGTLWGLLAFVCLPLAWVSVPVAPGWRRRVWLGLRGGGIVGLVTLLALFRREPGPTDLLIVGHIEGWTWLRTGWWGILGLIGWAYLTVSLLYLLFGHRREWLMGALAGLLTLHLATHNRGPFDRVADKPWLAAVRGALDVAERGWSRLDSFVSLGDATGSLAAITMAGCLLGSILRRDGLASPRARLAWAATFMAGLLVAGALFDTFEGINKNGATPTWACWSAALALVAWMPLYLVIDVAGRRGWTSLVRPAGANPLVAYLLHPIVVAIAGLCGLSLLDYTGSARPWQVIGGSSLMAVFICGATAGLARLGLRVRL